MNSQIMNKILIAPERFYYKDGVFREPYDFKQEGISVRVCELLKGEPAGRIKRSLKVKELVKDLFTYVASIIINEYQNKKEIENTITLFKKNGSELEIRVYEDDELRDNNELYFRV